MKVCDAHPDRQAVDTMHIERDDSRIDVCAECKSAVFAILSSKTELGASPVAASNGAAKPRGPKRGLSSLSDS